jgi:heterotetrameric sarcosine oxidase gamma subunit
MRKYRLDAQAIPGLPVGRPHDHTAPTNAGVTLAWRPQVSLACVMARKGHRDAVAQTVRAAFGLTLPVSPRYVTDGSTAFVWAGPGHWLALADNDDALTFEARLRDRLPNCASICGQSDGRCIIRISGPNARDALAKVVPIDLHPREFGPGHAAVTLAGHIGIHLWQTDAVPSYDIAVFRSLATALWQGLVDASLEFGLAVIEQDALNQAPCVPTR